jgi:septum formation protein
VEESQHPGETPAEMVCRLAVAKAETALAAAAQPCRAPILAADTIVVLDGRILGKPAPLKEAATMLRMLSGREHQVLTGVCLLFQTASGAVRKDVRLGTTSVRFATLTEREIQQYVNTGEPLDKAGAYGIQGRASKFVERIEGCYFNVVGLPIALVYGMLKELEASLPSQG